MSEKSTYFDPLDPTRFNFQHMDAPNWLKSYLDYKLAQQNCSPATIYNYFVSLKLFLRWLKCRNNSEITVEEFHNIDISDVEFSAIAYLTPQDIAAFMSFLYNFLQNGEKSRQSRMSAISSLYEYAIKMNYVGSNPTKALDSPIREKKLPRYLEDHECEQLLAAVPEGKTHYRDLCILTVFLNTGIRLSELVKINISDIRNGDTLLVHGKGRKERMLYLNDACQTAISDYMEERSAYPSNKDIALFISNQPGRSRLSGRRVEQIVSACYASAGLSFRGYTPHTLRHTLATSLMNNEATSAQVRDILGHSSLVSTERYVHSAAGLSECLKNHNVSVNTERKTSEI